jgi:hypothetical protein
MLAGHAALQLSSRRTKEGAAAGSIPLVPPPHAGYMTIESTERPRAQCQGICTSLGSTPSCTSPVPRRVADEERGANDLPLSRSAGYHRHAVAGPRITIQATSTPSGTHTFQVRADTVRPLEEQRHSAVARCRFLRRLSRLCFPGPLSRPGSGDYSRVTAYPCTYSLGFCCGRAISRPWVVCSNGKGSP